MANKFFAPVDEKDRSKTGDIADQTGRDAFLPKAPDVFNQAPAHGQGNFEQYAHSRLVFIADIFRIYMPIYAFLTSGLSISSAAGPDCTMRPVWIT